MQMSTRVALLPTIGLMLLLGPAPARAGWVFDTVAFDADQELGWCVGLALDELERPVVAYMAEEVQVPSYEWHNLRVRQWDGSAWSELEPLGQTGWPGFPDLEVTTDGTITLCAQREMTQLPCYSWDGAAWQSEWLGGGDQWSPIDLVVDDAGSLRLGHGSVRLASRVGGTWWDEAVLEGFAPSVGNRGHDEFHLSLSRDDELHRAWWDGAAWTDELIATGSNGAICWRSTLRLDDSGEPRIAAGWQAEAGGELRFYRPASPGWSDELLDQALVIRSPRMELDGLDRPHIAYYALSTWRSAEVRHAWWDGAAWQVETVMTMESMGFSLDLALDSQDRPWIAFQGGGPVYGVLLARKEVDR